MEELYEFFGFTKQVEDRLTVEKLPVSFGLTENFNVHFSTSGHPKIGRKQDFVGGGRLKIDKDTLKIYRHSGWFSNINRDEAFSIATLVRDKLQLSLQIEIL